MAQALLKFLDVQYVELDGNEYKFVKGVMGIFGHGNVTGIGEALENYRGTYSAAISSRLMLPKVGLRI